MGGILDADLAEGNLFGALAGDILVVRGLAAEVLQRQGIHVVAAAGAVEHVGLEHRVEGHAAHLDSIQGEHVHVVLNVLPHLGPGAPSKPFNFRVGSRQLVGAGILVAYRTYQLPGLGGAETHQLGLHGSRPVVSVSTKLAVGAGEQLVQLCF
jgi:hypothetical protein